VSDETIEGLLDEMEEYYGAFDHFPLYLLGWQLNDGSRTVAEKHELARQAFDTFTGRHPSKVVWVKWPLDLDHARPMEPGTPLDFELDPDGPGDAILQVLVPD
jgi:hypothetical protein